MTIIKKIEQSVVSLSNDLQTGAGKLQSSSEKLKKYLDDRKNSLNKFNTDMLGKAQNYATDVFGDNTLTDYSDLVNQIKSNIDPRIKRPKTYDPNFDGGNENTSAVTYVGFNPFSTSDTYQPVFPSKNTTPISATKPPKWAMVLKLVLPLSATAEDIAKNQPTQMVLLVNPSSWTRSVSKVQQNVWTRNGVKTERWGEDLEQIQASGTIGGFYTNEHGLNRFYRWQTPNYTQFMKLVQFYKNNGCTYGKTYSSSRDFVPSSRNRILDVGYIEIYYGGDAFRGNFESFEITEEESTPFSLKYDFTFNCSEVYSIFDYSSSISKNYVENENQNTVVGGLAESQYNDRDSTNATATEAVVASSGSSMIETNPLFTSPNKVVYEVPKDTLFPSLVSGVAKTDATKPYIFQSGDNTRSGIKVDFRSSEESSNFFANLPSDPNDINAYVNDFVEKQKNRSTG